MNGKLMYTMMLGQAMAMYQRSIYKVFSKINHSLDKPIQTRNKFNENQRRVGQMAKLEAKNGKAWVNTHILKRAE